MAPEAVGSNPIIRPRNERQRPILGLFYLVYSKAMENLSTHGIVALVRDSDNRFLLLEDARDPMKGH